MQLEEILPKLTAWFEPSEHKERKLRGGSKWFYVPHQCIVQRLNKVCPGDWSSVLKDTIISGDYTVVFLEVTICGVTHTGVADNKTMPEINDEGKEKIIGSPVVNAFRAALKDAFEQFGICAYLDEQTGDRQKFIQYMSGKGDQRALKANRDNSKAESSAILPPLNNGGSPLKKSVVPPPPLTAPKTVSPASYSAPISNQKNTASLPGLRPQNNSAIASLLAILEFDQKRFDAWFEKKFPGIGADMLSAEEMHYLIQFICKTYANEQNSDNVETKRQAIEAISDEVIGRMSEGIALKDALNSWMKCYFGEADW